MPIYEYTCKECQQTFDFLAKTLADRPTQCPACGGHELVKAFSSFQAAVKSSGACAHSEVCPHAHGAGCGCGCCH